MTHSLGSVGGEDRTPPLSQDLGAVQVRFTRKPVENSKQESDSSPRTSGESAQAIVPENAATRNSSSEPPDRPTPELQVRQLTAALEDIVTLALSNADYKERAIMMHRRAVVALSGFPPSNMPEPKK